MTTHSTESVKPKSVSFTKTCSLCRLTKPIEQFYINNARADKHDHRCIDCFKEYHKQYERKKSMEKKAQTRNKHRIDLHPPTQPKGMKICSTCRKEKSFDAYYNNSKTQDGKEYRCIECSREYKRAWYKKNNPTSSKQTVSTEKTINDLAKNYARSFMPAPTEGIKLELLSEGIRIDPPSPFKFIQAGSFIFNLAHITCVEMINGLVEIELVSAELDKQTGIQTPRRFLFDGAEAKRLQAIFLAMVDPAATSVLADMERFDLLFKQASERVQAADTRVAAAEERAKAAEAAVAELRKRIKAMIGE